MYDRFLKLLQLTSRINNFINFHLIFHFRVDSIFYHITEYYIGPADRMHPYLAGATVGYVMFRMKDKNFQKNSVVIILYWIVAISSFFASLFVTVLRDTSNLNFALALSFGRYIMGLVVGSVVVMCHFGYGGIINTVFSSRFFVHINKTTYVIYLVHPTLLFYFNSNQESSPHFDVPSLVSDCFKILFHCLIIFIFRRLQLLAFFLLATLPLL